MTKTEHILAIIKDSRSEEETTRRIEDFLREDYHPLNPARFCPGQQSVRKDISKISQALSGMRCARITCHDPQSGPIYCGRPGYLYGWSKNYPEIYYVMCEECAHDHGLKL